MATSSAQVGLKDACDVGQDICILLDTLWEMATRSAQVGLKDACDVGYMYIIGHIVGNGYEIRSSGTDGCL